MREATREAEPSVEGKRVRWTVSRIGWEERSKEVVRGREGEERKVWCWREEVVMGSDEARKLSNVREGMEDSEGNRRR